MMQEIANIFNGIQSGEIRIGSKKTRGFGKLQLIYVESRKYGKKNYLDYVMHMMKVPGKE